MATTDNVIESLNILVQFLNEVVERDSAAIYYLLTTLTRGNDKLDDIDSGCHKDYCYVNMLGLFNKFTRRYGLRLEAMFPDENRNKLLGFRLMPV